MRRRSATPGATASIIALLVAGCVVSSDSSTPPDEGEIEQTPSSLPTSELDDPEQEILASTITSSTGIGHELQIDIIALERLPNGILRLRIEITNNSTESFRLYGGMAQKGDLYTASGITLIDAKKQHRYLSYNQSDGNCFCQQLDGPIESGDTEGLWVAYPEPPDDLEEMTIITPLTPPLLDVPINDSSKSLENSGLSDPQILDLTFISDDIEDQTGRTESGDEVSIILSSDVLFDTGNADLSSEAEEILQQVATEVGDAGSFVVSVDGYADNTGNDSINTPLSLERAEVVESVLADLITRTEVAFEVNGHGSSDPIADNSTEEGRERNRRVSITFEK